MSMRDVGILDGDLLAMIVDGNRLVEFEDGDFAWVRKASDDD